MSTGNWYCLTPTCHKKSPNNTTGILTEVNSEGLCLTCRRQAQFRKSPHSIRLFAANSKSKKRTNTSAFDKPGSFDRFC